MNEEDIKQQAEQFARVNRQKIAKELTDKSKYTPENYPISVFMAGSPGAGKTEFSKRLIEILERENERKVVRIDGDELRGLIPGYTGKNSYLFQTTISLIVERIHDIVLDNNQTFLLDGTLSKYDKAADNIKRSLSKNRPVFIFYVYQKPEVAWRFTEAREAAEGRHIPKDVFIDQFILSRETLERIRNDFKGGVSIFLVKKNFETHKVEEISEVDQSVNKIDGILGKRYTKDELNALL